MLAVMGSLLVPAAVRRDMRVLAALATHLHLPAVAVVVAAL
jgi:hypothetical protein